MEYEIQDEGEDALFDESTNPSLDRRDRRSGDHPAEPRPAPSPQADPRRKRTRQGAELIPEEEDQLA